MTLPPAHNPYPWYREYKDANGVSRLDLSHDLRTDPNSVYYQPMTYAQPQPHNAAPAQWKGRIALFPPQRPGKVSLSGSCDLDVQELPAFIQWLQSQQPDQYGKIRLRVALFDSMSKAGRPYLSGYLQAPQVQPGGQAYSTGNPQGFPQAHSPAQSAPPQTGAVYQTTWHPGASAAQPHQHAGWQVPPQAQTSLPLQPPSAAPGSSPQAAGSSAPQAAPVAAPHVPPQGQPEAPF